MQKITPEELNNRIKWPTEEKIRHAIERFLEYYIYYQGNVYLGFSGGKDSQILAFIIDEVFKGRWADFVKICLIDILHLETKEAISTAYNDIIINKKLGEVPFVFCDTGLEFPELRKHVKSYGERVVWLKPKMKFPDVIKNIGVAVISKKVALQIRRGLDYIKNPSDKNAASLKLFTTGIKKDGTKSKHFGLGKWLHLLNAPFKISDKCCDIFKKEPWQRYTKLTGRKAITATTVVESQQRRAAYLASGCNTFEKGKEMCRPMSIFTERDVWAIAEQYNIRFCEVYYERTIKVPDGNGGNFEIIIPGENRTGCMFCLFGIHLEPKNKPNRFQRLAFTHPKQYEFMINECGLGVVMDFIKVNYKPSPEHFKHLRAQQVLNL